MVNLFKNPLTKVAGLGKLINADNSDKFCYNTFSFLLGLEKNMAAKEELCENGNCPLRDDESEVLNIYRKAKMLKYADISIAIQEGKRVKLWLTEKRK